MDDRLTSGMVINNNDNSIQSWHKQHMVIINKKSTKSLYQRILGAISFSSEKIMDLFIPSKSQETCLPLPRSVHRLTMGETLFPLIVKTWEHTLNNYHAITQELEFWTAIKKKSKNQTPEQQEFITDRLDTLDKFKFFLPVFLSKFYLELDEFKKPMASGLDKPLALLLLNINRYFLELESDIGNTHFLGRLSFEKLSFQHLAVKSDRLDHVDLTHSVELMLSNLKKLDTYLSALTNHHEPKIITRRWLHYTFGAIGISVLSVWLLRDSRLSGIISNWVLETKDSTVRFLSDNVEQPLTTIRDGLFEAYRNRNKGVVELKELQSTSDLLHSTLLDFSERTGQKFPPNASDQEMFDMVADSYEKQLRHPIQDLIGGLHSHSMRIHLMKLKLDIQKTIPELNYQLLRASQCKFVILAAIPTIFISLGVCILSYAYACVKQGTRTAQERTAQAQRTKLLLKAEDRVKDLNFGFTSRSWEGEDRHYVNGLLLYTLDRFYRAVERHSQEPGNWQGNWPRWRQDIVSLGDPNTDGLLKLRVISRFKTRFHYLFSP